MLMVRRRVPNDLLTEREPLSITLDDGTVVTGTLWLHPSRRGRFEVQYKGVTKSDGRTDYTDETHMRLIARIILREMAKEIK
jgi:hypothetical protein